MYIQYIYIYDQDRTDTKSTTVPLTPSPPPSLKKKKKMMKKKQWRTVKVVHGG